MTYLPMYSDLEYLRNELADRMEAHQPEEWSPGLIRILIAAFDAYLGHDMLDRPMQQRPATVLELVRPPGGRSRPR